MSGPEEWARELAESKMAQLPRGVVGYAIMATGGTQRGLAAHLGVSTRTVERWMAYERGLSGQKRNPRASPEWGRLQELADEQRFSDALDELEDGDWYFESDGADAESDSTADDEGPRHARSVVEPMSDTAWIDALRTGAPASEVGELVQRALCASYGVTGAIHFTDIQGLRVAR